MSEAVRLIQQAGLPVPVVSGGGTPQMWEAHKAKIFNEHCAGTYVYNDRHTVETKAARPDDCALRVLATVASRPTPHRAILDAGSKALSSDLFGLSGYGMVLGYPQVNIVRLSGGTRRGGISGWSPKLGDRSESGDNTQSRVSSEQPFRSGARHSSRPGRDDLERHRSRPTPMTTVDRVKTCATGRLKQSGGKAAMRRMRRG